MFTGPMKQRKRSNEVTIASSLSRSPPPQIDEDDASHPMDWSDLLPPELLHLISKKFSNTSDLIHFRGVCKTWRASASVSHLPSQIPCFLPSPDRGTTTLQFYSLASEEFHTVDAAICHDQTILGSSNGFLFTRHLENPDLSLLNPVTNCKVTLPFLHIKMPELVWASPDPVRTDDYAVCIFGIPGTPDTTFRLSAFWRPGEMNWTTINYGSQRNCYHEGKYLILLSISRVLAFYDVAAKTLPDVVPPPPDEGLFSPPRALIYIVVSAGQVLRVHEHELYDDIYVPGLQCRFDIHRLDFGTKKEQPFWVKIDNIGDQILFLNVFNCFSISASCFEGFKGNSIYFLKELFGYFGIYILCRYDIEAGTTEVLPFPAMTGGVWFVRSLIAC